MTLLHPKHLITLTLLLASFWAYASHLSVMDKSSKNGYEHNTTEDMRRKIRLGFTAPSTIHRQLLLTEDENATPGIDWGYDSEYLETPYADMYWQIEDYLFTIQGTNIIDEYTNFPIGFHTYNEGITTIEIDALENISNDFNLFLYDSVTQTYHDLKESAYQFYAEAGEYLNRFVLTFSTNNEALSVDDHSISDQLKLYYNSDTQTLTITAPNNINIKNVFVYTINGQKVNEINFDRIALKYNVRFSGKVNPLIYIITIEADEGHLSEKVLLR